MPYQNIMEIIMLRNSSCIHKQICFVVILSIGLLISACSGGAQGGSSVFQEGQKIQPGVVIPIPKAPQGDCNGNLDVEGVKRCIVGMWVGTNALIKGNHIIFLKSGQWANTDEKGNVTQYSTYGQYTVISPTKIQQYDEIQKGNYAGDIRLEGDSLAFITPGSEESLYMRVK